MKRIQYCLMVMALLSCITVAAQNNFTLPKYEKFALANGLTFYLMEQKEIPMINVSAVFPAGAIYDEAKAGLANLTALALRHGTKSMTKSQIEAELDFIGATLNTAASKEYAELSAKFAVKDRDKVLSIIREVLTSPSFDAAELEKEKQKLLVGLEQAKESPRSVIGNYFNAAVFGNHPYANPTYGYMATVKALTADDVKKFYQSHYMPNGAAIAVVGDFNPKEMKAKLSSLFNGWPKGAARQNVAAVSFSKPGSQQVVLVNKDDASETTFYIGGPGVSRSNPDFVAIQVVNTVFGGRFTSWLNDELRINTGLTYGAGSSFNPLKHGGTFAISTFTATKNTEAAIDKALEVFHRLHNAGLGEKDLTSAKNYVKGQFPPRYETAGQLANLLTQMFWYGFDETYINNFQKEVDGLTVEKAKEIVAKYFPKENLQFIMIGKGDAIRKLAAKYGKVSEVNIKDEAIRAF